MSTNIGQKPLYQILARLMQARINCEQSRNVEWFDRHTERMEELVKEYMPSGSGIDCGTKLDLDRSDSQRLFFTLSFHHMNEAGYYDGWTEHTIKVSPSLGFDFELTITGRDRNSIKEYLYQTYQLALETLVDQYQKTETLATERT